MNPTNVRYVVNGIKAAAGVALLILNRVLGWNDPFIDTTGVGLIAWAAPSAGRMAENKATKSPS